MASAEIAGWSYTPGSNVTELMGYADETIDYFNSTGVNVDRAGIKLLQVQDEMKYGKDMQLILDILNEIAMSREQVIFIQDNIRVAELKIEDYSSQGVDVEEDKDDLESVRDLLTLGKFDNAEGDIMALNQRLDSKYSDLYGVAAVARAARSKFIIYLREHWRSFIFWVFIFLLFVLLASCPIYRKILTRRIYALKVEEQVLGRLMQETQKRYFQDRSIAPPVYKIRMEKYRQRIAYIKHIVPRLEMRRNCANFFYRKKFDAFETPEEGEILHRKAEARKLKVKKKTFLRLW